MLDKVLPIVASRLETYLGSDILDVISDYDAMFARDTPGAMKSYMNVGRSAIEVIAQAMILTGKTSFEKVLDLPCGGGRVSRHLAVFFSEAKLFIGDLDKRLEAFVAETFEATPVSVAADFCSEPNYKFNLIFVGSLLTHLSAAQCERAVRWFIQATAEDGLLVLTTNGRRHDFFERTVHKLIEPERWASVARDCLQTGYGYVETELHGSQSYGLSWSTPSWIMRLLETDARVRIVHFAEAAWDDHLDVVILQRRPLDNAWVEIASDGN